MIQLNQSTSKINDSLLTLTNQIKSLKTILNNVKNLIQTSQTRKQQSNKQLNEKLRSNKQVEMNELFKQIKLELIGRLNSVNNLGDIDSSFTICLYELINLHLSTLCNLKTDEKIQNICNNRNSKRN